MGQYNDPKQVDILSESSNILAPKKNLYVRPAFFFSNRIVCIYNGHTIRDKTAGYKNKECVFMLDFFKRLYYNSIERS